MRYEKIEILEPLHEFLLQFDVFQLGTRNKKCTLANKLTLLRVLSFSIIVYICLSILHKIYRWKTAIPIFNQ